MESVDGQQGLLPFDRLDAALRPVGLRIHQLHHDVRIARTVTTVDPLTLDDHWRIHLARRSLTITQARLLKHIRDGVVPLASNRDTQKVRLPELRQCRPHHRSSSRVRFHRQVGAHRRRPVQPAGR